MRGNMEDRTVDDKLDERVLAELKFRQEWAAEARRERELREKILKGFYAFMAVFTLFIVLLFFF
jgi:UDP-2,3-diacylglucosamine pyrophosphatase LpxH